jgi:hypothetical protein
VLGSVSEGCESTMLKDLPPAIEYVITWRWSPSLLVLVRLAYGNAWKKRI